MAGSPPARKIPEERTLLEGLIRFLTILVKYKSLLVVTTLTAAAISGTFSIISLLLPPEKSPLPNTYRAYAVILLQQGETSSLESTLASLGLIPSEADRSTGTGFDSSALAIKVMNSREFLDTIVEDLHFLERYHIDPQSRTAARGRILAHSKFEYDRATRTLTISYTDIDPVFAHDLVKRVVDLLNEWFQTRGGTNKLKHKTLLEQKMAEVSGEISRLEDQVKNFQETYGVMRVEDLAASQSQILNNLRSQLRLKEIEIQNYSSLVKIVDPTLVNLRAQRENLLDQIKLVESGSKNPSGTLVPSKVELPELAQRFDHLTSALTIQKKIFETLSQQYELTKLSLESEPVFTVLDAAEIPDHKTGPSRAKICLLTTALALLGSMAVIFLLHSLESLILDSGKARRMIGRAHEE